MMVTSPAISVIMPVGDREAYLQEAVNSILSQEFKDFELIIIEDAVGPAVSRILDAIDDPRMVRLRLPVRMGVSGATNAGLVAAKAPYIALMDSDDIALPSRLAKQWSYMQSHPSVTVCGSNAIKILPNGQRVSMRYPETDAMIKARLMIVDSAIINPTVIYRTAFIRQHRIFYDAGFPPDQDHRFFVELVRNGAVFYALQEELLLYRRHDQNLSSDHERFDIVKTRIRELLMAEYFPGLSSMECRVLLRAFHRQLKMDVNQAAMCLTFINRALEEGRSFRGEDRQELRRILSVAKQRVIAAFRVSQQPADPSKNSARV